MKNHTLSDQGAVSTSRCFCERMKLQHERSRYELQTCPHRHRVPLRDDGPTTKPCSGLLCTAAQAQNERRNIFSERPTDPSDVSEAAEAKDVTPTLRPSTENNLWNSYHHRVEIPGLGSTRSQQFTKSADLKKQFVHASLPSEWIDKALRYMYTSSTQRGYADIDWDSKLPPRLKPPATTLEKMCDPVSQCFTMKRYHSRPEIWQAVGPHWNRLQLRATYNVKKPISFTSPCPKSQQIPLYSGVIGSENMDHIDIPEKDFIPLTVLRTVLPPYTPTAFRPTIPGYTGKALHDRPHTPAINQPSSLITSQNIGAPLSRTITTVPPGNPYHQPPKAKAPRLLI